MGWAAATLACTALAALVVNFFAGVDGRCSDGWGGCGWIWQISGWVVLLCAAGVIGIAIAALVRRLRR